MPKSLAMFREAMATFQPKQTEIIGSALVIVWSDEAESFLLLEKLRRACPCAWCKGEPDVMGHVVKPQQLPLLPKSFLMSSFEWVGGYGFRPVWGDGHDFGIFTFSALREIGK